MLLLGLLFTLSLAASAHHIHWFTMSANVQVNSRQVSATVVNSFAHSIYCAGTVTGVTQSGLTTSAWLNGWISSRQSARARVYTWGNQTFVNGWAKIDCHF